MPLRSLLAAALLAIGSAAAATDTLPPDLEALRAAVRGRELDVAVERGERATRDHANDARAWWWLGRAYALQAQAANVFGKPGWAGKCRSAFERAVALDGTRTDIRADLLQFYALAPRLFGGSRDKAEQQAAAIAELDATSGAVARAQIALLLDKDAAAAEKTLRAALQDAPFHDAARTLLTRLLADQKRWDDAFALWERSLAAKPDEPMANYAYGRLAALSGLHLEEGLAHLDRYLAAPDKPADIGTGSGHWRKGLILEKLGKSADAAVEVRAALAEDPALGDARKDLARIEQVACRGDQAC